MTDVQLRFLRAILERLPLDRIAEVHLFPPMRQGVMESGIAVIASPREEPAAAAPAVAAEPEPADAELVAEACDPTEDASREAMDDVAAALEAPAEEAPAEEAPADEEIVPAAPPPSLAQRARGPAPVRHTVYTARYRLALKGPERGKWELNVVEEADAPLLTVEMVVRGVQQRAGDGAEPERYDVAQLRELLEGAAAG